MIAKIGDYVKFSRKNIEITGVVTKVRDKTVIVQISKEIAKKLDLYTELTVVRHNHYAIVNV